MRLFQLQISYAVARSDIWGPRAEVASLSQLTEIEIQLLRYAARGLNDKAIANHLGKSPSTVRHHMRAIRQKLDVRTRFQVALHTHGLLTKERDDA